MESESESAERVLREFDWLAELHKSQCFTTSEVSCPAKSSDFGADGYTASLTDWHELLQLTAPDPTCGLVFVRGQFPNTADAILARAQRRDDSGSKGTLGTRLQPAVLNTDLELGERRVQGWINLKWPYSQYELKQKTDIWDGSGGTLEQISFVRSWTVFQILRLQWGHGSSLSDYDSADAQKHTFTVRAGGVVQFGCPCSNGGPPNRDIFTSTSDHHGDSRLSCLSNRYEKRFEMRLFINGVSQDLAPSSTHLDVEEVDGTEIDLTSLHTIELSDNEPVYIVSTYALKHIDDEDESSISGYFTGIEDHLGISNTSVNMTDRLWTAASSTNYEAYEAVEICAIGRCIEQILSVAAIPFYDKSLPLEKSETQHNREVLETALVDNIINSQHVDVQSAFFQIRVLVKVYNHLATRHFEPDLLERFQSLDAIRTAYLQKLLVFIRSTMVWLINTEIRPSKLLLAVGSQDEPIDVETHPSERLAQCERDRISMNHDQSYNQACYATLAVWYIIKHCPLAVDNDLKSRVLLPKLHRAFEVVQKRASRDKEPTPKNDVLQWFHLSCFYLICNETFSLDGDEIDGFTASEFDPHEVLKTQQKFEKYVSRLKTSQIESYSIEHEELHRVILLGEELGLDSLPTQFTASLASSRAIHTRRWLAERKRTTRFNPGPALWKSSRMTSNGPWELLATNHQSFLRIADDASIIAARNRLFEFMMSDFTFMASWDYADKNMIGSWWNQEPGSVICATLIDLRNEGKMKCAISESAAEKMGESIHDILTTPVETSPTGPPEEIASNESIRDILLQIKQHQVESSREQMLQFRQLLVQEEIGANLSVKAFDWMTYKPPRVFHPSWWVQSLTDTPEFYRVKQNKDVPLRKDLRKYLVTREHSIMNEGEHLFSTTYTTANINKKVHPEDVQFLSLFDIELTDRFTFESKATCIKEFAARSGGIGNNQDGTRETATISRTRSSRRKQRSTVYSQNELVSYQNELFIRLNDSLVDLGAKHRILFAEKCTPSLVRSFIYVWHPDALDTFDNYFGSTSIFAEHREAVMWTTNITITHWSIRPTSLSKEHIERFRENRNNGDFPPLSIAHLGSTKKQRKTPGHMIPTDVVEERSSSLVITGDPSGHLWICSIWSSLTDSEAISGSVKSMLPVLGQFIHQQACARCLAFLILLGHLCERLAAEYDEILSSLDKIVGLGERVLLEGLEWGTSEAVDKLKKMLWGLEALRVFDDRLSASLGQIQKARESMERTIKQEAGQQHVDLLEAYNNVIEEFEKRFGMLSDVQVRTQLKIRQVTGLRDGISTVTNVEDSQTALRDSQTTIRQGNNIRILTYITIAYLPLGFVAALFSVDSSYVSFMNSANNVTFAVLVVVFVLGTYALALSLESIINSFARISEHRESRSAAKNSNPPNNSHRDRERSGAGVGARSFGDWCGLRRRRVGSEDEVAEKISMAA